MGVFRAEPLNLQIQMALETVRESVTRTTDHSGCCCGCKMAKQVSFPGFAQIMGLDFLDASEPQVGVAREGFQRAVEEGGS